MPYQKRVIDAVRKTGHLVILHMCGKTTANFKGMMETGACGISVDQRMDMGEGARKGKGHGNRQRRPDDYSTVWHPR